MRTSPALAVFLGNSWDHNFDNKMWFSRGRYNRSVSHSFPKVIHAKSNCLNLKMKDRL